jgi:hypothetical protein
VLGRKKYEKKEGMKRGIKSEIRKGKGEGK